VYRLYDMVLVHGIFSELHTRHTCCRLAAHPVCCLATCATPLAKSVSIQPHSRGKTFCLLTQHLEEEDPPLIPDWPFKLSRAGKQLLILTHSAAVKLKLEHGPDTVSYKLQEVAKQQT